MPHSCPTRRSADLNAPPPKEKNERKKELAANAIDRPNTIWMSLRAPPLLSPKASVRPVMIMIITAMILATGPSMDSRIDWSGASQGMADPPAWAAGERRSEDRRVGKECGSTGRSWWSADQ